MSGARVTEYGVRSRRLHQFLPRWVKLNPSPIMTVDTPAAIHKGIEVCHHVHHVGKRRLSRCRAMMVQNESEQRLMMMRNAAMPMRFRLRFLRRNT